MSEVIPPKSADLQSQDDNIRRLFETYHPDFAGKSLVNFLNNHRRVVVKNDPALIEVFGQETVDRYEALLAKEDL